MTEAKFPLSPARPADVRKIQTKLAEAIDTSPYYGARFKQHEKARFSERYLRTLIAVDPWHIALFWSGSEIVGIVMTLPDFGTLWTSWVYVNPAFRAKALGLSITRSMIRHFDHGRFHKIACFVRPDNRTTRLVVQRLGFTEVAHLKEHIFGEDYLLFERPLTKSVAGYDGGVNVGRVERLKIRLAAWFGR
jgi:RimJ/RimL family protein N-acetyltransferase